MKMYEYLHRYGRNLAGLDPGADSSTLSAYKQDLLSALLQIGRGLRVLDVGCMDGQFSRFLMDQRYDVWGVEVSPAAAEEASRHGIQVKVANIEEGLPFVDGFFDVIHAGDIIEHLFDTKNFFSECSRVLKSGGLMFFTVPNLNSLENRIRVVRGQYLSNLGAYPEDHFGQHIRVFNQAKVRELCQQTGFAVEEIRGIIPINSDVAPKLLSASTRLAARWAPGLTNHLLVRARKGTPFST